MNGGPTKSFPAALVLLAASCAASDMLPMSESHPEDSNFVAAALIRESGGGWWCATVTVENKTDQDLVLEPSRFELRSAPPVFFVPSPELSFGRRPFSMPRNVVPHGVARGELFFLIKGDDDPVWPLTLVVHLPDGDSAFVFYEK